MPGQPRKAKPSLFDHLTRSLSFTPEDGVPNVSDLPHDLITRDTTPYMERYYLLGGPTGGTTTRYHHILTSDTQDLHDHPWDFMSIILDGTYIETTPTTEQHFGPGSVLLRRAEQQHRLTLPTGPVWTLVILGPARRRWGFNTPEGWVHWSQYLQPEPRAMSRSW